MGYSLKVLASAGLVEVARTAPGTSFVERFYRLTRYGQTFYALLRGLAEVAGTRQSNSPGQWDSSLLERATGGEAEALSAQAILRQEQHLPLSVRAK
jgi:hypothetical protein